MRTATALVLTVAALFVLSGTSTAQQSYPSKPIRLIVPYPPGGSVSNVAQILGQKLTERWGQAVIVDHRPGGSTIIGTDALAKSSPDGYTLMLTTNAHVINPSLFSKLPYDSTKDFAPVATVIGSEFILVVSPSVPANNLQELIALAKAEPGRLNYASTGNGSPNHLAAELLNVMTGIQTTHVPYKGSGQVLPALLGGEVQLYFVPPSNVIGFIASGKLKGIAVSGDARTAAIPSIPTFAEAGLPGLEVQVWFGMFAPAGTPREIVDKLSSEIGRVLAMPEINEKLLNQGLNPLVSTSDQFGARIAREIPRFSKLVKVAGIKVED